MSPRVWKYDLPRTDRFTLTMPEGADLLAVQLQRERPCLWAMVDPEAKHGDRHFHWIATGEEIPAGPGALVYIATVQASEGYLVYHLFERVRIDL